MVRSLAKADTKPAADRDQIAASIRYQVRLIGRGAGLDVEGSRPVLSDAELQAKIATVDSLISGEPAVPAAVSGRLAC